MNDIISGSGASYADEQFYCNAPYEDMEGLNERSFPDFVKTHLKKLKSKYGRKFTRKDLAHQLGFRPLYFDKIVNKNKPTKKRDCIIAICAALEADSKDTNCALYCYGYMDKLDEKDPRDLIIINILDRMYKAPKTIAEINEILEDADQPPLYIKDDRNDKSGKTRKYPYSLVRKHFQCTIGAVKRLNVPEYFLDLTYDTDSFYSMMTCMEFDDNGKRYEISIRYEDAMSCSKENLFQTGVCRRINAPKKKYIIYTYPFNDQDSELREYDHIEDTGEFENCFLEIIKTESKEKKKLCSIANDTRNYGSRISAKVIDSELYIFCEEYNCDVPELSEYYLMVYCNGEYRLYLPKKSCFMQWYMPKEKYREVYGKYPYKFLYEKDKDDEYYDDSVPEYYDSIGDIEMSVYAVKEVSAYEPYSENAVIELRINAYKKLRSRIDALIRKLISGEAHICNADCLEDNKESIITAYFNAEKEFGGAGNESGQENKASFVLSDGEQVELSMTDLIDGFELGLKSIDEIDDFLQKHGSLKIKDVLKQTGGRK